MHFEILVEDQSGAKIIDILIRKIIDFSNEKNTLNIEYYKGIGRIPKGLKPKTDANKRQLLDQLPRLVQGYGKTWNSSNYSGVLIIICDLDERCFKEFRQELFDCVNKCQTKPELYFCIAVKQIEAWLLGDISAIKKVYPKVKRLKYLKTQYSEEQNGTWEKLADTLVKDGSKKFKKEGKRAIGKHKSVWAEKITPHIDIDKNASSSFRYFRDKLRKLSDN